MQKILFIVIALGLAFHVHAGESNRDIKSLAQSMIENHPLLQSGLAQIHQAERLLDIGARNFQPLVNLYYNNSINNVETKTAYTAKTSDESYKSGAYGVQLKQNLFENGQTINNANKAKLDGKLAEIQYGATENGLLLQAVAVYSDLRKASEILRIQQENYNRLETSYKAALARLAVGEITKTDVALAKSRLERANADIILAQNNLNNAKISFTRLFAIETADNYPALPIMPITKNLDEYVNMAIQFNYDLRAQRINRLKMQLDYNNAMASTLPSVDLTATAQNGVNAANASKSQTASGIVGITISTPLYAQGVAISGIKSISAGLRAIDWKINDTLHRIQEDTSKAYNNYQSALQAITAAQYGYDAAKIAFEGVSLEAEIGNRTILDELDIKQELLNAELARKIADINVELAYYQLIAQTTPLVQFWQLQSKYHDSKIFEPGSNPLETMYDIYSNIINENPFFE